MPELQNKNVSSVLKNVPLFHNNIPLDQKRVSNLNTAQQDKQYFGTFLWNTQTFFGTPDILLIHNFINFQKPSQVMDLPTDGPTDQLTALVLIN